MKSEKRIGAKRNNVHRNEMYVKLAEQKMILTEAVINISLKFNAKVEGGHEIAR